MPHRRPPCSVAILLAILALHAGCAAPGARLTAEECDALYEALSDEMQRAVRAWSQAVEASRGTQRFDEVAAQGLEITRAYVPRFDALAARGCARAKLEAIDLRAHLGPLEPDRADAAIDDLASIVRDHAHAWWIADVADDDVLHALLASHRRDDAIALVHELATRTSDEEAHRALLLELGLARSRSPRTPEERADALRTLDGVVATWPDSPQAERARLALRAERELQVGQPMPPLEGRDVDGQLLRLSDLRGRVVVVDFFGFWCTPCREALPRLRSLVLQHAPDRLALLGVDAHDDEETFRRGREAHEVSWPCIFDGPAAPLSRSLGVASFPLLLVVDRDGVIRARNPPADALEGIVRELVAGSE